MVLLEEEQKVETYYVRLYCECGGEMKPNGMSLMSNPPQYPHNCDRCGYKENISDKRYPLTIYKYVKKDTE